MRTRSKSGSWVEVPGYGNFSFLTTFPGFRSSGCAPCHRRLHSVAPEMPLTMSRASCPVSFLPFLPSRCASAHHVAAVRPWPLIFVNTLSVNRTRNILKLYE
ncbi:hypothetical protein GALMADRAFT_406103 [Galerina marginata CBS 339.88]|uniref:Uncharacterized protein n=1 Tax=Galerina marginata (strain CBS 339.88) TaxID=685588 RepID=A0A067TC80_GALM3|nr:hypothetical protein GALMADRAFT_406103 [Galerina marginata CBS 339.88]